MSEVAWETKFDEAHNLLEPKAEASADLNHIILIRVLFTTAE